MVLDHVQERRKLVEALEVIKRTCSSVEDRFDCKLCPLYDSEGVCYLGWYSPEDWIINDSLEGGVDWRAFK